MKQTILLMVLMMIVPALAEDSCQHDENNFRCVTYIRNYDADTITFHIPNMHPLFGNEIPIRVKGVDTPEIRTKDACEKDLAKIAKARVATLLKNAKRIDLTQLERGKYFRVVADVIVDGKSLSEFLLKTQLAYSYDGGRKKSPNWCQRKARIPAQER